MFHSTFSKLSFVVEELIHDKNVSSSEAPQPANTKQALPNSWLS
jgi:hypothetical protein